MPLSTDTAYECRRRLAWYEEDETVTEGLPPINARNSQRSEQSKNHNRSIKLRSGLYYLTCRCQLKIHQVGCQMLRRIGRADTLELVEYFQCFREDRLKAKFTLVRVIDALWHRKGVGTVRGLLVAAASLRSLPLCVPT
jgi:hypothetical protein